MACKPPSLSIDTNHQCALSQANCSNVASVKLEMHEPCICHPFERCQPRSATRLSGQITDTVRNIIQTSRVAGRHFGGKERHMQDFGPTKIRLPSTRKLDEPISRNSVVRKPKETAYEGPFLPQTHLQILRYDRKCRGGDAVAGSVSGDISFSSYEASVKEELRYHVTERPCDFDHSVLHRCFPGLLQLHYHTVGVTG